MVWRRSCQPMRPSGRLSPLRRSEPVRCYDWSLEHAKGGHAGLMVFDGTAALRAAGGRTKCTRSLTVRASAYAGGITSA